LSIGTLENDVKRKESFIAEIAVSRHSIYRHNLEGVVVMDGMAIALGRGTQPASLKCLSIKRSLAGSP